MCECSRSSARRPRRGVSCVVHNSQLLLAQVLSRPVLAQSPIIGLSPETSKPRAYILEMSLATNNTWMLMTCCNSFQQGKKEVVIIQPAQYAGVTKCQAWHCCASSNSVCTAWNAWNGINGIARVLTYGTRDSSPEVSVLWPPQLLGSPQLSRCSGTLVIWSAGVLIYVCV